MRSEGLTIAAVLTVAASIVPAMASGQGFKIVVNESNPTTSISKQELSRCFLKQTNAWINGRPVIPVDQATGSETRETFSQEIHDRDVQAIKSYWQRQIFSGRGVPPTERTSDAEVLAFVRMNEGAIGYVAADTDLGIGVKVLEIADR